MASSGIDLRITGGESFAALSKRLKGPAQKTLRLEMNKAIREAAKPMVADLKAAVMAVDSKVDGKAGLGSAEVARAMHAGSRKVEAKKSHGLRATIARSIQLKITASGPRTGVRIRVDGTKLPEDERKLPMDLDNPKGWRHPVFGNRDKWVTQHGRPWWDVTILKHKETVRSRILDAMKSTADKIKE